MTFKVAIFGHFPEITELKLQLPPDVMDKACDVMKRYRKSYCSCSLWNRQRHPSFSLQATPLMTSTYSLMVIRSLVDEACRAFRMVGVTLLFSFISLLQLRIFDSGFLYYGLDEDSNHFIHKLYSFY